MKVLLVLFLIITCNISLGQKSDSSISYNDFENGRESIKKAGIYREFVYVYLQKKDKTLDSAVIGIITYDTSGLALRYEKFLMAFGESKSVYFYNEADRLIKIVTSYPKGPSSTQEFHYDSIGNEIFRSSYSNFHRNMDWKEYDERGRLTKISSKINYDKKYLYQKIYYEKEGALIRTEGFYPNGAKSYTEFDEYSSNWLVKKTYLNNSGQKMLRSACYYNHQHQLIRKESYAENASEKVESAYRYNDDGTTAEQLTSSNGTVRQLIRHYYFLFD